MSHVTGQLFGSTPSLNWSAIKKKTGKSWMYMETDRDIPEDEEEGERETQKEMKNEMG